jgi:uncharacterized membrane protein
MLIGMHRHLLPAILLFGAVPAFGAGFHALSLPGSQLGALSADGRSAAGGVVDGASGGFRWHEGAPPQLLAGAVSARAISASGRYVAGSSLDREQREVATWWDIDGIAHPLGGLPGADALAGVFSVAYGITDQPLVVGTATIGGRSSSAFAWTPDHGMHALTAAGMASSAAGVSSDGRRVFGWSARTDATRHGALWSDGHLHSLADDSATADELVGANRAATVLLGMTSEAADDEIPFRWALQTRAVPIAATPLQAQRTRFIASSDDGRVLAGAAGSGGQRVAVIWTQRGGVEHLDDFLAAQAIAVPRGWTLIAATAVSADGHRLGGFGLKDGRFDSFVIDLPSAPDSESRPSTAP